MIKTIVGQKLALFNNKKQILILKRSEGSRKKGTWDFPGGMLEKGESLEENLTRELKEETGITEFQSILPFHVSMIALTDNKQLIRIFNFGKTNQTVYLSTEHSEYRWINLQESENYIFRSPDFKQVFERLNTFFTTFI